MHDEQQHHEMGTKDRGALGGEARLQPSLQIQAPEEQLQNDGSRKGSKLLILEAKTRELVETGQNVFFPEPHLRCPPGRGRYMSWSTVSNTPFSEGAASDNGPFGGGKSPVLMQPEG